MEVFNKMFGVKDVNSMDMSYYDAQKKFVNELMSARGADVKYNFVCTPLIEEPDLNTTNITWLSPDNLQAAYANSIHANSDYFVMMVSLQESQRITNEDVVNFLQGLTKEGKLQMVIYSNGVECKKGGATQRADVECYFLFSNKQENDSVRFCYIYFQPEEGIDACISEIDAHILSKKIGWGAVCDNVCSDFVIGKGKCLDIKYSEIEENGYILNPHFYFLQDAELRNMSEGDVCVPIKDILSHSVNKYEKIRAVDLKGTAISSDFSDKIGEILYFKPSIRNYFASSLDTVPASSLIVKVDGTQCKFLWNSSENPMGLPYVDLKDCWVISYNSDIVDGAYITSRIVGGTAIVSTTANGNTYYTVKLIKGLPSSLALATGSLPTYLHTLLGWGNTLTLSEAEHLKIIIPSKEKQKAIVQDVLNKYNERVLKEQAAERERLGIRSVRQDIDHMLASPLDYQNLLVELLSAYKTENSDLKELIDDLVDNTEYISRVISNIGKRVEDMKYNFEELDIVSTFKKYCASRAKYYDGCFTLGCKAFEESIIMKADRTMLLVMMDSLIDNAYRHGFGKMPKPENQRVEVYISKVQHKGVESVYLCIRNNGKPMSIPFEDYITKGHFDPESGHTGYGGYHIYEIVKKHGGDIAPTVTFEKDTYEWVEFNIWLPINK